MAKVDISDIELFFDLDLKVKKLLVSLKPPVGMISEDEKIKYVDKLLDSLDLIKDSLFTMSDIAKLDIKNDINIKYVDVRNNIINSGENIEKINSIYQNSFIMMNKDLPNYLKQHFAWKLLNSYSDSFKYIDSFNDILHLLHHKLVNDEANYKVNTVDEKIIITDRKNHNDVSLMDNNIYAKELFDNISTKTEAGYIDILGLNNRILVMTRDLGHATTLDCSFEDDNVRINYFIPKICNIDKVNLLPGVNKVSKDANVTDETTGEFVVTKEEFAIKVSEFLNNVPTDYDINIEINNAELEEMLTSGKDDKNEYGRN